MCIFKGSVRRGEEKRSEKISHTSTIIMDQGNLEIKNTRFGSVFIFAFHSNLTIATRFYYSLPLPAAVHA